MMGDPTETGASRIDLAEQAAGGATDSTCSHYADRKVEMVATDRLAPHKANAPHSRAQIRQIASSVKRFGFTNPVLVDDAGGIIAGHGRVEAAKLLGLREVPPLRLSHLTDIEVRAYIIADNKLAQMAGWDLEILAVELQGLIEIDFDVELSGFGMGEIDIILENADEARRETASAEDEIPGPLPDRPFVRSATSGCWASIACSAATPATMTLTSNCSTGRRPSSFSLIPRTTCQSRGTFAALAPFIIASSPWRAARSFH